MKSREKPLPGFLAHWKAISETIAPDIVVLGSFLLVLLVGTGWFPPHALFGVSMLSTLAGSLYYLRATRGPRR